MKWSGIDLRVVALSALLVVGTLTLLGLGFSVDIPGFGVTDNSPRLELPASAKRPEPPPPVRLPPSPSSPPSIQPPSVEGVKKEAGNVVTVVTDTVGKILP